MPTGRSASEIAGLSPRVRGNLLRRARHRRAVGSIPACAGEPGPGGGPPRRCRVYPRVCGGTSSSTDSRGKNSGLSPRVRGNPAAPAALASAWGSIPACAGEPVPHLRRPPLARVYPRVCGGTAHGGGAFASPTGLSPRVRGNLLLAALAFGAPGSIPACAGEPIGRRLFRGKHRVYPRVCGGTSRSMPITTVEPGLSPRVRGTSG